VYAARKPGAAAVPPTAPTPYKAIDLADVVSGQFDDEDTGEDVAQDLGKRVLAPQTDSPKLHKVLAQAGMGSRLEMEKLITEGRIAVNNEPAHVGQRVQYGDQIKVDGKPIRIRIDPPPARVIAYHKPAGEIVSHDDPQNRPSVFRKLPRLQNGKWQSVGRLDLNTEGLLLFTSSGELANQLMHPRFGLEREYAVRVLGALSKDEKQKLLDGVMLDDGPAQFGSIEDGGGEGSNCWYRVTISEGRNREVRRMMEAVGHAVSRLIRIRYGAMVLPHGLRRGAWLELDEADIRSLMRAAGTSERPRPVTDQPTRTNRNDRRPRTGGQGRAGTAVPRAKPAAKPNQAPGGSGLHAKSDAPKSEPKYIGAESFNRLKNTPGGPGRGGRGGSGRSR
jgi:23S rRNA pseudouridine2605 synthase